jgi:predicted AAA+ superfamily ATPase
VVDTGFIANRTNSLLGENTGWRLENAVCIELLRRHRSEAEDIYYYKPSSRGKEVDFVVCRQGQAVELVQVAYLIDDKKTYNREVEALCEAGRVLGCDRLTLVSFSESRSVEVDGQRIEIYQAVEWFGEDVG